MTATTRTGARDVGGLVDTIATRCEARLARRGQRPDADLDADEPDDAALPLIQAAAAAGRSAARARRGGCRCWGDGSTASPLLRDRGGMRPGVKPLFAHLQPRDSGRVGATMARADEIRGVGEGLDAAAMALRFPIPRGDGREASSPPPPSGSSWTLGSSPACQLGRPSQLVVSASP